MKKKTFILGMFLLFTLIGCRQSQQDTAELQVDLQADSMEVGETTLMVTISDTSGDPVENATVTVRGNMSHAGMVPVTGTAVEEGGGVYTVPFEWTMGGDWYAVIEVKQPDGRIITERIDGLQVEGEMEMDDMESTENE